MWKLLLEELQYFHSENWNSGHQQRQLLADQTKTLNLRAGVKHNKMEHIQKNLVLQLVGFFTDMKCKDRPFPEKVPKMYVIEATVDLFLSKTILFVCNEFVVLRTLEITRQMNFSTSLLSTEIIEMCQQLEEIHLIFIFGIGFRRVVLSR